MTNVKTLFGVITQPLVKHQLIKYRNQPTAALNYSKKKFYKIFNWSVRNSTNSFHIFKIPRQDWSNDKLRIWSLSIPPTNCSRQNFSSSHFFSEKELFLRQKTEMAKYLYEIGRISSLQSYFPSVGFPTDEPRWELRNKIRGGGEIFLKGGGEFFLN